MPIKIKSKRLNRKSRKMKGGSSSRSRRSSGSSRTISKRSSRTNNESIVKLQNNNP